MEIFHHKKNLNLNTLGLEKKEKRNAAAADADADADASGWEIKVIKCDFSASGRCKAAPEMYMIKVTAASNQVRNSEF